ncbi:hypothetical protein Tco_1142941 [Tanacetum coccineum]
MVINSPCLTDKKELVIPGQTETSKEFSNPLMAGSLPKTIILEYCPLYAIVDGKAVVISESSVRSDLLFNNKDALVSDKRIIRALDPTMPNVDIPQGMILRRRGKCKAVEILKLKKRVKKLERKMKSSISHLRRRIYRQVESSDDDLDMEDASKQGRTGDKTKPMFIDSDFDVLDDDIENIEEETVNAAIAGVSVVSAPVTTADEDLTIAQTLVKIMSEKAKEKGVAFRGTRCVWLKEDLEKPWRKLKEGDQGTKIKYKAVDERDYVSNCTHIGMKRFDEIQADMDADHDTSELLVMKRFEDNTPEGYNLLPWGDLKVMFEPNVEDEIWSNQQDWTLISWKLYENCGVHLLLMDGTLTCFNMLVEKIYPLIKEMLEKMFEL